MKHWFHRAHPAEPDKLKMGLVTFLGVLPLTSGLPPLFGWLLPSWHFLAQSVLVTALIVAALTWPVMPLLTRLFGRWLYGKPRLR